MPSERSPLARQLRVLMLVVCLVQLADGSELSDKLILDLADGEYRVREKAQSDLLAQARQQPEASKDKLFQIAQTSQDPEIRERCLGVLRQLLTDQYMSEGQGFVGIGRMDKTVELAGRLEPCHGVLVTSVRSGTPAERAGIQLNDLIIALNKSGWKEVTASETFANQVAAMKPGTKISLSILRDEKVIDLDVVLVRRPAGLFNELLFMPGQAFDPEKAENDAMAAYFRDWFSQRITRK